MRPIRALLFLLGAACAFAQRSNFLQQAFGVQPLERSALLAPEFPGVSLLLVNRNVEVAARRGSQEALLRASGSEATLVARLEHAGVFELCRIRHEPGTPIPADDLKLVWAFPMEYNESMTLDAGALEGHPLYLPGGSIPPSHLLNWGSLFYNRSRNLALGTMLEGGAAAAKVWNMRSGPAGPTQLHFWTMTGKPDLQVTLFAYRPKDARLWWAEWYQEQERRAPGSHPALFPVLSPLEMSWAPGESQTVDMVPPPADAGRAMEFILIDDVSGQMVARRPFAYELPVTHLRLDIGDWPTGLYRAIVAPAGAAVDPAVRNFSEKMLSLIVRPRRAGGQVLFVAPTDMWRAYASNGGHAMTSWREDWHYNSVGYSPTVLNTRFRRTNHYYYGLYERHSDIQHYRFLRELSRKDGFAIDYATQDDVALGRVRLADYRLVMIGSHAEFTTAECWLRFRDYMAGGGAVMIHGGDSFAVMVEYLPGLQDRRYIWQKDHIWCHLTDQPDRFQPPQLLFPDAPAQAAITSPQAGDAVDYLNLFHVSVTYWPHDSRAIVSNVDHPVIAGLGLKLGDAIPGTWAGEADVAFEPQAWNILLRSDRAVTEAMESGLERVTQPPFHHTALMIHKNLRLAEISGESFTNLLADPKCELFQRIYARTLHYLLDPAGALSHGEDLQALPGGAEFRLEAPATLRAIQYALPDFIRFEDPLWFRQPAPYAHYVVEGSADGRSWFVLVDRSHGPWRGRQTDFFAPAEVRQIRFRGTFSNGELFRVEQMKAFRAP